MHCHYLSFLLLLLALIPGSSTEAIKQDKRYDNLESHNLYSSSYSTTAIVHETYPPDIQTPTTSVPIFNPAPTTTTPTNMAPTTPIPTTTTPSTTAPTTPIPNMTTPTTDPATTTPTAPDSDRGRGGGSWCVANPTASEKALQVALDYVCGYGGTDCSAMQSGGSCYNPNTVRDHASYAFNQYYQKNTDSTSCVFGGAAQLVNADPSSGSCRYSSKLGSASTSPATPTPAMETPPSMMSPTIPQSPFLSGNPNGMEGGGGLVEGAEPIGSPNAAASTSQQLLLLFCSSGILMYAHI